jgi:hypothetical protein
MALSLGVVGLNYIYELKYFFVDSYPSIPIFIFQMKSRRVHQAATGENQKNSQYNPRLQCYT